MHVLALIPILTKTCWTWLATGPRCSRFDGYMSAYICDCLQPFRLFRDLFFPCMHVDALFIMPL